MLSSIANAAFPLTGLNPLLGAPSTAAVAPEPTSRTSWVGRRAASTGATASNDPCAAGPTLETPVNGNGTVHGNYTALHNSLASSEDVESQKETGGPGDCRGVDEVSPCGLEKNNSTDLPPLVLIHGLKGGHLRDSVTGKRRYLRVAQLFNPTRFQDPPALPLKRDPVTGAQPKDTVVPDGIIDGVDLLGVNLASYYGPFKEEFGTSRDLKLFSYDWRRDLDESGEALEEFLEGVIEETGSTQGVQVVCHSMGGLITFPVINRRPELFHSVLFAAAALGGGVSFLRDLAEPGHGNAMGPVNDGMFTPERWASWPSVWSFFNIDGEREAQGKSESSWAPLTEADGTTPVPCDFHNLEDWKRLKLGPYGPDSGISEVTPEMEAFLQGTLTRAKAYRQKLVHNPAITYPPIAVLRSDAVPTITKLTRLVPDASFDYKGAITSPGDGRITLEDTLPPRGVPVTGIVTNHADHSGILSEFEDVKALLGKLLAEANERKEAPVR